MPILVEELKWYPKIEEENIGTEKSKNMRNNLANQRPVLIACGSYHDIYYSLWNGEK